MIKGLFYKNDAWGPLWLLWIMVSTSFGCESGGCYYTCCRADDDCVVGCGSSTSSAEECTVLATKECTSAESSVKQVQWATINDVVCQTCESAACAPEWWTADKYSYQFMDQAENFVNNIDTNQLIQIGSDSAYFSPDTSTSLTADTSDTISSTDYSQQSNDSAADGHSLPTP